MATEPHIWGGEQQDGDRFAWVLAGAQTGPDRRFDIDLAEFRSAAVVPTKGALLRDWLLIVPRQPCLAVARMAARQRLDILRCSEIVAQVVTRVAGSAVVFEHGASEFGAPSSCGVDQAHLHVVGVPHSFVDWVVQGSGDHSWVAANRDDPWIDVAPGSDYLLVLAERGAWTAMVEVPTSQYLRKRIAAFIEQPEEWDYRKYPNAANAKQTAKRFSRAFRSDPA